MDVKGVLLLRTYMIHGLYRHMHQHVMNPVSLYLFDLSFLSFFYSDMLQKLAHFRKVLLPSKKAHRLL